MFLGLQSSDDSSTLKPRHDLRYPSMHFSRPYPVRINPNSTNCCVGTDLCPCRRRVRGRYNPRSRSLIELICLVVMKWTRSLCGPALMSQNDFKTSETIVYAGGCFAIFETLSFVWLVEYLNHIQKRE
jgi:hypothetical protein